MIENKAIQKGPKYRGEPVISGGGPIAIPHIGGYFTETQEVKAGDVVKTLDGSEYIVQKRII